MKKKRDLSILIITIILSLLAFSKLSESYLTLYNYIKIICTMILIFGLITVFSLYRGAVMRHPSYKKIAFRRRLDEK